jgi:hypothetical protein
VELAPVRRLYEAPRPRAARLPAETAPAELAALDAATRRALRALAVATLDGLGVRDRSESIVHDEMVRQFAALAAAVPAGPGREARLRAEVERLVQEGDAHG